MFTLFPALPAELRVKIWQATFEPRVLEIHSKRAQLEIPETAYWCSNCGNPVALSVCEESRLEALYYYVVILPVGDHNGDITRRLLYINPANDTLVMLGDVGYSRLRRLFDTVMELDPEGRGLQRIGLSINNWTHQYAREMLQFWSKALFSNLEQFVLLMYTENLPPADFRGGECSLEECIGMESFLRLATGHGYKLKSGEDWIVVGKAPMRVMYLKFHSRSWAQ